MGGRVAIALWSVDRISFCLSWITLLYKTLEKWSLPDQQWSTCLILPPEWRVPESLRRERLQRKP